MILNEITQDKNKVLGDKNKKTIKFHGLERSMEEILYKFKSVIEAEQQNGVPNKNDPWHKMKTPPSGQTRNREWINPSGYGKTLKASP